MTDRYPGATHPVDNLMNDLRNRGSARLIQGRLGQPLEVLEVRAEIVAQPDLWDDDVRHEELMVTLDTLESILRWGRTL